MAIAGRPVGRLDQVAGRRADRDDDPGRGAVDGEDRWTGGGVAARAGHGTDLEVASRSVAVRPDRDRPRVVAATRR